MIENIIIAALTIAALHMIFSVHVYLVTSADGETKARISVLYTIGWAKVYRDGEMVEKRKLNSTKDLLALLKDYDLKTWEKL